MATLKTFHDYQIRFLDVDGILIEDLSVFAESLGAATERAAQIAREIGAADFIITLRREAKGDITRARPSAR